MNQMENLQGAIDKYKARLREIDQLLAQPMSKPDRFARISTQRIREEQIRLERKTAELEAEVQRELLHRKFDDERALELLQGKATQRIAANTQPRLSVLECAKRAVKDPAKHPSMKAEEVRAILGLGKSAVYSHPRLKRVTTGTRAVRFSTKDVKEVLESSPE